MSENTEVQELIKWPASADGMNVDLMLRILGHDAQVAWLTKWAEMAARPSDAPEPAETYLRRAEVIAIVGLMAAIRCLRAVNPQAAEDFVKDYWLMCDAGDSFGEMLWQWTNEAGLNPELITLQQ